MMPFDNNEALGRFGEANVVYDGERKETLEVDEITASDNSANIVEE